MFRAIKQKVKAFAIKIKTRHEKRLIIKLQSSGWFPEASIDVRNKKLHLGLYSFIYDLAEPKEKMRVQMLVMWHGWRATEERLKITNIE